MAVKKSNEQKPKAPIPSLLPLDTMIEMVMTNGDMVEKTEMQYVDGINIRKRTGWKYQMYQIGVCSIPATNPEIIKK